ncbi:MAG: MFS transporter [Anaerolineae bacterium]|nr:MFS transporter [Anaerolineae bacterium]
MEQKIMRPLFHSGRPVPPEMRKNFVHLYLDIAWFGVLSASAMSFLSVYAARLGATGFQIGLLSAAPAAVNLLLALPSGRWLEHQRMDGAVFWSALLHRAFYLLWIPLPMLLAPQEQIWTLVAATLAMSIPGTVLSVGFNALFADVVPPEWRGHVVGVRNAVMAVVYVTVSLLAGYVLDVLPFPKGYQVVFAIGFVGAVMSTFHLRFVVLRPGASPHPRVGRALRDPATPGRLRGVADALRPGVALRFLTRRRGAPLSLPEIIAGPFGRVLLVLFAFHLAVNLAIPLFPIHWVSELHLSDRYIGLGTALFYVSVFLGSTQLNSLVQRIGNRRVTAVGAMIMSLYPALMALASGATLFLIASAVGGFGWSLAGGALANYLLEEIPADRRPAHLAWYNLAMNAALLLGSMAGPILGRIVTIPVALGIFAVARLVAAIGIWCAPGGTPTSIRRRAKVFSKHPFRRLS